MADGICICGNEVPSSTSSGRPRKHCSKRCSNRAARLRAKPCSVDGCDKPQLARKLCSSHYCNWHRSQLKYTIKCHCGKTAQVQRKRSKHCSYKCGMDAVNAAKAGMQIEEWLSRPDSMRFRRRLSRMDKALRKAAKAAKGTTGRTKWIQRTCKICPNTFITQSSTTGLCCSKTCTKTNKRAVIYDRAHRRRAKIRDAYIADVNRLEIFKRDKLTCHICGKKTDPHKCAPHPKAPTIDHIVPIAKGGTHEPANVATACFMCNATKSDRGGGEQLALIG